MNEDMEKNLEVFLVAWDEFCSTCSRVIPAKDFCYLAQRYSIEMGLRSAPSPKEGLGLLKLVVLQVEASLKENPPK